MSGLYNVLRAEPRGGPHPGRARAHPFVKRSLEIGKQMLAMMSDAGRGANVLLGGTPPKKTKKGS